MRKVRESIVIGYGSGQQDREYRGIVPENKGRLPGAGKNEGGIMENLISVIVPVYNTALYLGRCIDSILAGTYEDLEIILVDDGSTDSSGEICDTYADRDPRVRVLHTENAGLSAARNRGLDTASGEFISFVDSDDYIHPEMLQKLHEAIRETGAPMSICSYIYVDEGAGKKFENKGVPKNDRVFRTREILTEELFKPYHAYWIAVWAKLYRAEIWSNIRFPEGKCYEDLFAMPLVYLSSENCACIDLTGYYYMQHADSIVNARNAQKTADHIKGLFALAVEYSKRDDLRKLAYIWLQRGLWEMKSLCVEEKQRHGKIESEIYTHLINSFRTAFHSVRRCPIPVKQRGYLLFHDLFSEALVRH